MRNNNILSILFVFNQKIINFTLKKFDFLENNFQNFIPFFHLFFHIELFSQIIILLFVEYPI